MFMMSTTQTHIFFCFFKYADETRTILYKRIGSDPEKPVFENYFYEATTNFHRHNFMPQTMYI